MVTRICSRHLIVFVLLLTAIWTATGQAEWSARVKAAKATIRVEPNTASPPMATVGAGTVFEKAVLKGDWVEVTLPPDASGFRRTGYIKATLLDSASPAMQGDATAGIRPEPAPTSVASEGNGPRVAPAAVSLPASPASVRPKVAVLDLDFAAPRRWWGDWDWDIGQGVASLIVNELVMDRTYRVVERNELAPLLAEQNFSNGNRADPNEQFIVKLRKVYGAQYLLVGNVTKFTVEREGWFGSGMKIPWLGGVAVHTHRASVNLTLRLINSSTSEVEAVASGTGEKKKRGVALAGVGPGAGATAGMDSAHFRDSILGQATTEAVQNAVRQLVAARKDLTN